MEEQWLEGFGDMDHLLIDRELDHLQRREIHGRFLPRGLPQRSKPRILGLWDCESSLQQNMTLLWVRRQQSVTIVNS